MHADAACVLAQAADADPLRNYAAEVVAYQNRERTEDVLRIAAFALGVPLERLEGAQLLWLDRLGIYLFAATVGGPDAQARPLPSCHIIPCMALGKADCCGSIRLGSVQFCCHCMVCRCRAGVLASEPHTPDATVCMQVLYSATPSMLG